ncbi:transcriptional regulator, TetR family [Actinomyces sp. oral taxon 848 str. F0332]|uniref:TetR family transcriptional regulator n=2 Tax=Peptidiphaga gingivicola TaxID=2741497 RepID=A0A179B3U8_9ACTO|nr:transcriptional regulator, TetR family [Actinomyces sp. oral taxon 848 str. F0332]OAP86368.1 TetR family transcriptional regulator [Peptidiphaga gingivicola]
MSRAERREQLIRVARQLFGTRGYDAVSVEEIASAAGVSKPIVYEHFGGKEGLYQVIVDREVKALSDILRSQMRPEHSARAVLEGIVVTLLDFIEENADGFHLLAHQSPTAVRSETFETVMADIADQVTIFLAPLLEKQGLDPASAPVYGQILAGGVGQIGQWWSENMQVDKKLVAAQVTNLLYLGLRGMEKDPQLQTR